MSKLQKTTPIKINVLHFGLLNWIICLSIIAFSYTEKPTNPATNFTISFKNQVEYIEVNPNNQICTENKCSLIP